jgi:hypothetical protein
MARQKQLPLPLPPGHEIKFVAWITKNGKRIYARTLGFKAFPLVVKIKT